MNPAPNAPSTATPPSASPAGVPLGFRPWELGVIATFSAAFIAAFYLYVTDVPVLRRYLLGLEQTGADRKAGLLTASTGKVRRQRADRSEFEKILGGEAVYFNDTLVTGPETGAEVQLDDGGQISLAENTMVKLSFDSKLSLGGVSRQVNIELVQGSLSGDSKSRKIVVKTRTGKTTPLSTLNKTPIVQKPVAPVKPVIAAPVPLASPKPEPVVAQVVQPPAPPPPPPPPPPPEPKAEMVTATVVAPSNGAILSLAPNSTARQLSVSLGWRTNLDRARTRVRVFRIGTKSERQAAREPIDDRLVQSDGGQSNITVVADRPGNYEWVVQARETEKGPGATLARAGFRVKADFEGIELEKPLVGGSEIRSNQADGKLLQDFGGVTLRWRPLADARKYKVRIYKGEQELKTALEKEISEPQYTFNRGKLVQGRFLYRVYALLPGGFVAKSRAETFGFSFLPPGLVQPRNGEQISSRAPADGGLPKSVLFTWQKTHFTDFYELEIAEDPDFKRIAIRRKLRENYLAIPMPDPRTYYWRVKALSQKMTSPPSSPNTLIIR